VKNVINKILSENLSTEKYSNMEKDRVFSNTMILKSFISVTDVIMTRDLLKAKVYWDCIAPYHSLVEREIYGTKMVDNIRRIFTSRIRMKFSPQLIFIREGTEDEGHLDSNTELYYDLIGQELKK